LYRQIFKSPSLYLFIILVLIYSPVLLPNQLVSPDAKIILDNLKTFHSFSDYLSGLVSLKTVDFQPIRDLTFYFDLVIEKIFTINSFVKINFIIWVLILLTTHKILQNIFPTTSRKRLFFILSLLAVHPIFTTSICWAMSRKHLLSCFFILVSTRESLKEKRSQALIIFSYFASIFSQPITLLWPVWLLIKDYFTHVGLKKYNYLYLLLIFLMGVCIFINSYYYFHSPIYHEYYSPKAHDFFNIFDRILSFGHYFFQLIFPYWISFNYTLESPTSFIGLLLLTAVMFFIFKNKRDRSYLFPWLLFSFFPLGIISTDAKLLSDTYLLVPATGFVIIFLYLTNKIKIPLQLKYAYYFFFVVWSFWSFSETFKWRDNTLFAKSNFERSPNCNSAFLYARLSFIQEEEIPSDLNNFILSSNCFKYEVKTAGQFSLNEFITVMIYFIYYDTQRSVESKVTELEKFKNFHYLSYFFLASLKINQQKFDEANDLIFQVITTADKNLSHSYEPVVARVLLPYCEKNKSLKCEEFMNYFSTKPSTLFFE